MDIGDEALFSRRRIFEIEKGKLAMDSILWMIALILVAPHILAIILAVPVVVLLKVWFDGTGFSAGASIFERHPCNDPAWTRAAEKIRRHPRLYGAGHFNLLDATRLGWIVAAVLVVLAATAAMAHAHARDLGQWENGDPAVREWYQALKQPDVPAASCCGEADAYWCDEYFARGGRAFCRITDDRPDAPRQRPHVDVGTEIEIPNNKLKWDKSNPTGHGVVFLSRGGFVYCFVQAGGA